MICYLEEMTARPSFDLASLRKIGIDQWNPIGTWVPDDEYDTYLLKAAGNIWNGDPVEKVAEYLVKVEAEWIGLGLAPDVHARAVLAAAAIHDYVRSLRE